MIPHRALHKQGHRHGVAVQIRSGSVHPPHRERRESLLSFNEIMIHITIIFYYHTQNCNVNLGAEFQYFVTGLEYLDPKSRIPSGCVLSSTFSSTRALYCSRNIGGILSHSIGAGRHWIEMRLGSEEPDTMSSQSSGILRPFRIVLQNSNGKPV